MAGFALVYSIKLTNGLIFYENIVKVNKAVFFPPGDTNILTVFISRLDLDLGIAWEIPAYIWGITATVIIVSHYG